jgi:ribonuclease HII
MTEHSERRFPDLALESELWASGYRRVAGLDEVGRGAWAGPVLASAVILPADVGALAPLLGRVDDSKRLSPAERERLAVEIRRRALAVGVGSVPASEIDRIGIVPATKLAMIQALACLYLPPDYLLLDYLTLPVVRQPQRGLAHGDALCLSIAAASIIAKVARDAWMAAQESVYAGYGFARHKGYGTAEHQAALGRLGPCPIHRLSFAPVAPAGCGVAGYTTPISERADTTTLAGSGEARPSAGHTRLVPTAADTSQEGGPTEG